jgi:hypothetical protein
MNLDDRYIYVFVRQDIPLAEQIVSVGHAAFHLGQVIPENGIPNLIVVGVPHAKALDKARAKMLEANINFHFWEDPDTQHGVTAVASHPLTKNEKGVLANYRLWSNAPSAS